MTKKSYNKFVATAATATLVASAIAPVAASADSKQFTDVNERYAPAVDYVVSKGVNGKTTTQFGVQDSIKRVDAAVFIANALDLNKPGSPDAGFSDVPARAQDAVNALKEKGIINGKTETRYGANDVLTRGEVALILANAYDLKGDANSVQFTDVNKNRYGAAVAGLVDAGVTSGISETKFGTENPVKRGDLAVFLYGLSDETPEVPSTSGITSVEAINDTTVEVKFGEAIDKDFIREAERNGEYFRVFLQGDSASSDKAIKSETITFENDGKTARFTLGETLDGKSGEVIESGKKYTVALTNGENKTADVIHEYGPTELKGSAAKPEFNVDAVADKIFVKFGEKMKSSALEVENYEVYDEGGKSLGDLADFIKETDKGTWVDATKKTEVEFTLNPEADKKLLAGKTYKLYVKENVKTDKNKTLSEKDRTISVKTPSINEAKPKAVMARVIDGSEIVVVFDKDVDKEITANKNQVEVKTTTGKTVEVDGVKIGDKANEIKITVVGKDDDKLNKDTTYNVDLPANAVTNAVFPNASNDAVSKLKAEAQDDVEIKSVKADLKASPKNKKRADLYLSFDQRPNLDTIDWEQVVIKDGSDVFTVNVAKAEENAKYNANKEIVIENVSEVFEMETKDGTEKFVPEKGTTYTFEIKVDGVETDSFGDEKGKTNQSKLKTTFGGVSVNAPTVDKVTLVSEKEIKVDFKEDISSISEDDIYVAGVELYSNGNFGEITLNGTDHLSASVSGSTLTLKTKGDTAFHTGFEDTNIEIKANAFTSKDNKVENDLIEIDKDNYDDFKHVDNAAPVMIGASTDGGSVNNDQVLLTFSESLEEHGDTDKIATLFSVKNAANNAVGKDISVNGNEVLVTFNDVVFDEDTVMSKVEVTYNAGGSFYLKDEKGNKAAKATVKGIKGKNPEANSGGSTTKPEEGAKVTATFETGNMNTIKGSGTIKDLEFDEVIVKATIAGQEKEYTTEVTGNEFIMKSKVVQEYPKNVTVVVKNKGEEVATKVVKVKVN
ncbi:S-layer homology domain-containing protein [Savagea faecisuis]|uniref:S-layer homology domain-containing protein n=1 Tax=Savagea faecisuis TaxID=1274803 RepID=A0ABW3GVA6_9BACL